MEILNLNKNTLTDRKNSSAKFVQIAFKKIRSRWVETP